MANSIRDRASGLASSAGSFISNLKGRFGSRNREADYGEYGYDEELDYDYDEYDYEETDDHSDDYRYNPYAEYVYDEQKDTVRNMRSSSSTTHPALLSMDDVRASTKASERERRENKFASASYARPRTSMGYASDYQRAGSAAPTEPEPLRSRGYQSLFASTASSPEDAPVTKRDVGSSTSSSTTIAGGAGYDPYASYEGTGMSSHTPQRNLTVLTPRSYSEVERIANALKAGDALVLSLRQTPSDLSKRVLDFSFGVASALDARVDCIADKVFVIARGGALTGQEKSKLQVQGVLP